MPHVSRRQNKTWQTSQSSRSNVPNTTVDNVSEQITTNNNNIYLNNEINIGESTKQPSRSTLVRLFTYFCSLICVSRRSYRENNENSDDENDTRSRAPSQFRGRNKAWGYKLTLSPTNRSTHVDIADCSITEGEFRELKQLSINGKNKHLPDNKKFPKNTIVVYTDGSASQTEYTCGIGIFHGPNHELNRSQRIHLPPCSLYLSDLAEITAANIALADIKKWKGYKNQHIILRTDYLNLVNATEAYRPGIYTKEKEAVRKLAASFSGGVTFQHVRAHEGDPGNLMADTFAKQATMGVTYGQSMMVDRSTAQRRERSRSRSRY